MLVLMTLTLTQGHSGSAKAKKELATTKQSIGIKLATMIGHLLCDIDFAKVLYYISIWLDQLFGLSA